MQTAIRAVERAMQREADSSRRQLTCCLLHATTAFLTRQADEKTYSNIIRQAPRSHGPFNDSHHCRWLASFCPFHFFFLVGCSQNEAEAEVIRSKMRQPVIALLIRLCWTALIVGIVVVDSLSSSGSNNSLIRSTTRQRRSILLPWTTSRNKQAGGGEDETREPVLGWAVEERTTAAAAAASVGLITHKVTVGWNDDKEGVTVELPVVQDDDSLMCSDNTAATVLASSLWNAGTAGAILCQSACLQQQVLPEKSVLELGSGVGLAGLVAARSAARCVVLTDHDERAVGRLQRISKDNVSARHLEWRDDHSKSSADEKYDVILATDVAYYFYLLRPLMDTIQAFSS